MRIHDEIERQAYAPRAAFSLLRRERKRLVNSENTSFGRSPQHPKRSRPDSPSKGQLLNISAKVDTYEFPTQYVIKLSIIYVTTSALLLKEGTSIPILCDVGGQTQKEPHRHNILSSYPSFMSRLKGDASIPMLCNVGVRWTSQQKNFKQLPAYILLWGRALSSSTTTRERSSSCGMQAITIGECTSSGGSFGSSSVQHLSVLFSLRIEKAKTREVARTRLWTSCNKNMLQERSPRKSIVSERKFQKKDRSHTMNRHFLWMLIGCTLPLLLIFLLPVFGIRSQETLVVFIILMFACHLMMLGGHNHNHSHSSKGKKHESH